MILPIKHKRGTTIPTANDLVVGEIAINTTTGVCYTKTGAGNVVAIGLDIAANWGNIGGTLSSQTDLQSALDAKYDASNPDGFIPEAPIDNYQYSRQNGQWQVVDLDGNNIPDYDNFVTYSAGAQVYFQGKLYRMVNTAGAAGYDPIGHPSYWESLSGTSPDLTGYATESWVQSQGYLLPGAFGTVPSGGLTGQVLTKDSSLDYAHSWVTPIVGDRYLTTSTTSNTIGNGAKTFTIGTGLSYTPQQDVVISAVGSAPHMHALVTSYNSLSGVLVVDVKSHTGSGTYTNWVVNVGGIVPLESVSWGGIIGTLSSQTDLQTALNAKLNLSGGSMSGKLNCGGLGPTASLNLGSSSGGTGPTTTFSGDVWILNNNFYFKDATGAIRSVANLSGDTFTGKVNHTSVGGLAGVNIGIGGTSTSATTAGDLWIATGGTNLNFRDGTGAWRVLATQGQTNTFSTNQIVAGASTGALLRVTQTGTGNALVVEDETSPDATPFVVGADGRVGIHGTPATNTAHKLAIYNGNVVFSSGFGLAFGDGTTQTTAGVLNGGSASLTTINLDPEGGFWEGSQLTKENYKTYFDNLSSNAPTVFTQEGLFKGDEIRLKRQTFTEKQNDPGAYDLTQDFGLSINPITGLSFLKNNNTQIVGTVRYEPTGVRWSDGTITTTAPVTSVAGRTGAITLGVADVSGAAAKAGDTFTGKVNMTPTASAAGLNIGSQQTSPSLTVAGDVWIGASINYRSWDGVAKAVANTNTTNQFTQGQAISVNSASNAFRINQQGTGPALVVEDSANPDTTAFVINSAGNVGIGVNPATWSPATNHKLAIINGSIVFSSGFGLAFGDGTTQTTAAPTNNSQLTTNLHDVSSNITLSSSTYANAVMKITAICEVTIPADSSFNHPIGTQIVLVNTNSGNVNFIAESGVSFNSRGARFTMNGQYSMATVIKVGVDEWVLSGDLV
jgi:hypothetical protein